VEDIIQFALLIILVKPVQTTAQNQDRFGVGWKYLLIILGKQFVNVVVAIRKMLK